MVAYSLLIRTKQQNKEVLQVKASCEQNENALLDALASYLIKVSALKLAESKA